MSSAGSELQITQLPNGSFCGTPSSVTSALPAPDGAIDLRLMPCVVGLAESELSRRKSDRHRLCRG